MLKWLRPAHVIPALQDLDVQALFDEGIRGILLDLDNTIMPWNSDAIDPEVTEWVRRAKQTSLGLCLVTNARHARVTRAIEPLGLPFVALARKPMLKGFRRALKILGTQPKQTAMVGDQIFTDVLGANMMGMHSVLIELPDPREQWWMKGTRKLESWVRRRHQ